MLKEALIGEPLPWLSGGELMWRTGQFLFIGFGSRQSVCPHMVRLLKGSMKKVYMFTWLMIEFIYRKHRRHFSEANRAATAQTDRLGDAFQLWSYERWAAVLCVWSRSGAEGVIGTQGCCMCPQLSAVYI